MGLFSSSTQSRLAAAEPAPISGPLIAMRSERAQSIEELLAGLIFLGDDRVVSSAWVAGREVWHRP